MQVNKYVHPAEKIPTYLDQEVFDLFAEDYASRDNERIKDYLIEFDDLVFGLLTGGRDSTKSRLKRFQESYLPADGYDSEEE